MPWTSWIVVVSSMVLVSCLFPLNAWLEKRLRRQVRDDNREDFVAPGAGSDDAGRYPYRSHQKESHS